MKQSSKTLKVFPTIDLPQIYTPSRTTTAVGIIFSRVAAFELRFLATAKCWRCFMTIWASFFLWTLALCFLSACSLHASQQVLHTSTQRLGQYRRAKKEVQGKRVSTMILVLSPPKKNQMIRHVFLEKMYFEHERVHTAAFSIFYVTANWLQL